MNVLVCFKRPAEHLRHHDSVLKVGLIHAGPDSDVSGVVDPPVTLVSSVWRISRAVFTPALVVEIAEHLVGDANLSGAFIDAASSEVSSRPTLAVGPKRSPHAGVSVDANALVMT